MKKTFPLILIVFLFGLESCKPLAESMANAFVKYIELTAPDSCDWILLKNVEINKTKEEIESIIKEQTQGTDCHRDYKSIKITPFGKDSTDVFIMKIKNDSILKDSLLPKYYRLIYYKDSLDIYSLFPVKKMDSVNKTNEVNYVKGFKYKNGMINW